MLIFICANVLTLFQLDYYVKSFAYLTPDLIYCTFIYGYCGIMSAMLWILYMM